MTPEELRKLADEATRAPFGWLDYYGDASDLLAQQRLARFAPDLARLCAGQHETLRRIAEGDRPADGATWHSGKSWRIELARAALAKLSELNNGAEVVA